MTAPLCKLGFAGSTGGVDTEEFTRSQSVSGGAIMVWIGVAPGWSSLCYFVAGGCAASDFEYDSRSDLPRDFPDEIFNLSEMIVPHPVENELVWRQQVDPFTFLYAL